MPSSNSSSTRTVPPATASTPDAASDRIAAFERRHQVTLDAGQRALTLAFTTDPRRLVAGIGPAGAGKTTAMRAVAETWRTTGGRVVPLAPSATAADVRGRELGCRAENLHKFQHTHTSATSASADGLNRNKGAKLAAMDLWFVLQPGDLVLIDEAGMAGTRILDWVTNYARERGAVVRLIGDPAQLTSVEAGGALRLITSDTGAVELTDLHRFANPVEATATIALREGRPEALDFYRANDRIRSGPADAMLEAAYEAWSRDAESGLASLLVAGSTREVTALNTRARLERVAAGAVEEGGVDLRDGTRAGVGDRIVTRTNDRRLTDKGGSGFVKNGDEWTVTRRHHNGDLTVTTTLPSGANSVAVASGCPPTTPPTTWNSPTPPPPLAPKAAPSTPPTCSSTTTSPANRCTSRPPVVATTQPCTCRPNNSSTWTPSDHPKAHPSRPTCSVRS